MPRFWDRFYPDAVGSTAYLADGNGVLQESYTYDLGGTPKVYDPSGLARSTEPLTPRLFTGQPWYSQLGLYDNRNRFLHADLGRFLQPDPIGFAGDPANLYRYCANNPVNRSDPYGLDDNSDPDSDPPKKHHDNGGTSVGVDKDGTVVPLDSGGGGRDSNVSYVPGGNSDRVIVQRGLPEPYSNPGGADSLFGHGGGPKGGGGPGGGRFVIDRRKLSSFGPSEAEGAQMRRFANAVDNYALGVSVVVALPVAAPLALDAIYAAGWYGVPAAQTVYWTFVSNPDRVNAAQTFVASLFGPGGEFPNIYNRPEFLGWVANQVAQQEGWMDGP